MRQKSAIYTTKQDDEHSPSLLYRSSSPTLGNLPAVGNDSQINQIIKTINLFVAGHLQSDIYVCLTNFFKTGMFNNNDDFLYIVEILSFIKKTLLMAV